MITKTTFTDNVIKGHVINAISLPLIEMKEINCTMSNFTSDLPEVIYNSIGGCFRTMNILRRRFQKVEVFDSFSDSTAFGLKIIDFDQDIDNLKLLFDSSFDLKVIHQ